MIENGTNSLFLASNTIDSILDSFGRALMDKEVF